MKKHLTVLLFLFITLSTFSQDKFSFPTDSDSKTIEYKLPGRDQEEVFDYVFEWSQKHYSDPRVAVSEDLSNKIINIDGSFYMTFNKEVKNFRDLNVYNSIYKLVIECYDEKYIIHYTHLKFILKGETISLTLKEIQDNPTIFGDWLENYEYRVQELLSSLYKFGQE